MKNPPRSEDPHRICTTSRVNDGAWGANLVKPERVRELLVARMTTREERRSHETLPRIDASRSVIGRCL